MDFGRVAVNSSLSWEAKTSVPISPSISGHKTSLQSQRLCFGSDHPVMISALLIRSEQTGGGSGRSDTISSALLWRSKGEWPRFSAFLRAIKEIWCSDAAVCFAISRGRGPIKMADLVAWRLLGQRTQRRVKGLLCLFLFLSLYQDADVA